jgi:3-methyladenine DNA glycosylase AlkD
VDVSADHIVGAHLWTQSRDPLYALAASGSLWERRISLLSCFHFIKRDDFQDLLRIARMLLRDPEDLIHKAAGWMLREVGKRDLPAEEAFLRQYHRDMPRTTLRYAIERFPEPKRKEYLRRTV